MHESSFVRSVTVNCCRGFTPRGNGSKCRGDRAWFERGARQTHVPFVIFVRSTGPLACCGYTSERSENTASISPSSESSTLTKERRPSQAKKRAEYPAAVRRAYTGAAINCRACYHVVIAYAPTSLGGPSLHFCRSAWVILVQLRKRYDIDVDGTLDLDAGDMPPARTRQKGTVPLNRSSLSL